jgi:ribonucleoside-diphosphate reductase beta chain
MYLSQLAEEALHVQFYLTLLDTYIPDVAEREQAFAAENIPSIRQKAQFCLEMDDRSTTDSLQSKDDRRKFLLNLICFATCTKACFLRRFCYVYFLRSKGLLPGLASGTNWVFLMNSAYAVRSRSRKKYAARSDLFDAQMERQIVEMLDEAVECEVKLPSYPGGGVAGLPLSTCGSILSSSRTSVWQCLVFRKFTEANCSRSWTCRTSGNSPILRTPCFCLPDRRCRRRFNEAF